MIAGTDRVRGLYVLTPEDADTQRLVGRVRAALAGGAALVQYRSKDAAPALRRAQATALQALCAAAGTPLVINDDPALAAEVGAAGVHVGVDDAPLAQARSLVGPARLVGVSCYADIDRARRAVAEGADYVAFGSFFASPTKPAAVRAHPQLIREARRLFPATPIVAIGGITVDNVDVLIDAGVDAVAVISAVFDVPDVQAAARRFAGRFNVQRTSR